MGVLVKIKTGKQSSELKELEKYGVLNASSDKSLDRFTVMAAILLDVPMAVISIADTKNIWYVSRYGVKGESVPRSEGLCAYGLDAQECYFVEDTLKEDCLRDNPMVNGKIGLRFYAGIPLISEKGHRMGSLCVMDTTPRKFTLEQRRLLELLADLLMQALEEKYQNNTRLENRNQLIQNTVHDLKNPLSVMSLLAKMIQENKNDHQIVDQLTGKIMEASKRMSQVIEEFLEVAEQENNRYSRLNLQSVELLGLIKEVVKENQPLTLNKGQLVIFKTNMPCSVYGDWQKLREVIENLLSNAVKFSPNGKRIWIGISVKENMAILEVTDEGVGLTPGDLKNMFRPFTTLSGKPTAGEHSSGLGLSIVRTMIEAHNGRITASSKGKGKGSRFIVELPLSEEAS